MPRAHSAARAPRVERHEAPAQRPRLTVLARPRPRPSSVPFALLCTLILAGALAGMLALNIAMTQNSYEITRLQIQSQTLTEQQQTLAEQNERLGTPQMLEKRAVEMGMVPASDPAYIDLGTGTVIGDPQPAAGDPADATPLAPLTSVPPAQIYTDDSAYHGMGNEGN
ncbi:MAG: hypothetical protein Q4G40_02135 [Brachybacterium sp.]|nr:hypothetical protein [Brachybacterium sp.]